MCRWEEVRKGHGNIPKTIWPTDLALNTHAVLFAENHPSATFAIIRFL